MAAVWLRCIVGPMLRTFIVVALAVTTSAVACDSAPKTCDPQPLPDSQKELAPFLPEAAVVCGAQDKGDGVSVDFKVRDVKALAADVEARLTAAGWSVSTRDIGGGAGALIHANSGPKNARQNFQANINSHSGGPNAGRVTGSFLLTK